MSNNLMSTIFGTKSPKPYTNNKAVPLENPCPTLLYGVELEIENCHEEWVTAGFKVVQDGSLRNGGLEFVSQPMTYSNMCFVLDNFFDKNQPQRRTHYRHPDEVSEDSNYSDRTSIHVHTNVNDLTLTQLQAVCLLYEVFERLLFSFIGNERDKNIFCVPWYETTLSCEAVRKLAADPGHVRHWQKYTALNLLPIMTQGSIEWRHMHGTADREFIFTWLRLIGHIYKYAMDNEFDRIKPNLVELNTTSAYDQLLNRVFTYDADRLRTPDYRTQLEDGVLEMKYSLMEQPKKRMNTKISFNDLGFEAQNFRQAIERVREDIQPPVMGFVRNNNVAAGAVAPQVLRAHNNQIIFDELVQLGAADPAWIRVQEDERTV